MDSKDCISNKLSGDVYSLRLEKLEDRFEKCEPIRHRKYLFKE